MYICLKLNIMAVSRMCADGEPKKKRALSCKTPGADVSKGTKGGDEGKEKKRKYYKTVDYTEKHGDVKPLKVKEETRLVVSDAIKEQQKPETKGVTFEGKTSDKTTSSGNKGESISKLKEVRYYKKRSKLGQALTGEHVKQKGGTIEEEKDGKTETIVYKGSGKRAKKYTEERKVTEGYKDQYEKAEQEAKKRAILGEISQEDKVKLASMPYKAKRTRGDDTDYTIGTPGKDTGKEIKISKSSIKEELASVKSKKQGVKNKGTRVRRSALSKVRESYGKA